MESMARANGACFSVGMIGEFVPLANAFQGTLVDVDGEDGEGDVLMQIARSVVGDKRCWSLRQVMTSGGTPLVSTL